MTYAILHERLMKKRIVAHSTDEDLLVTDLVVTHMTISDSDSLTTQDAAALIERSVPAFARYVKQGIFVRAGVDPTHMNKNRYLRPCIEVRWALYRFAHSDLRLKNNEKIGSMMGDICGNEDELLLAALAGAKDLHGVVSSLQAKMRERSDVPAARR